MLLELERQLNETREAAERESLKAEAE